MYISPTQYVCMYYIYVADASSDFISIIPLELPKKRLTN